MTDPCGNEPGFERVVACFMEKLILDDNSRSATLRGHIDAINKLFQLRNFKPPADLSDRTNMCARILFAREKEEDIARQRSPISREMFASLLEMAKHSAPDSLEVNVADWMIFVRITGLCCAEYAQKNQSGVDEHLYPSGKRVVKAFLPTDWEFYDDTGAIISIHPLNSKPQDFPQKESRLEYKKIGKMAKSSPWSLMTTTRTSARSELHTESSSEPRGLANQIYNQWACLSISLA